MKPERLLTAQPKKKLVWFGGSVLALLVVLGVAWRWLNVMPQVEIPSPKMPQPNGYDYFLRAGEASVPDRQGVDEVTDPYVPTGDQPPKHYPLAAKEAWLHRNAKALHLLREGLQYPALHPPVRSVKTPAPEYAQFRGLARALVVESRVRAELDDWHGAVRSVLDGVEFGYDIPRGAPLLAARAGAAVQALCLSELWNLLPHLDTTAARQAATRLEQLHAGRYLYAQSVQNEKWLGLSFLSESMSRPGWRWKILDSVYNPYFPYSWSQLVRMCFISKSKFINDYLAIMNVYITRGACPTQKR